MYDFTQDCRTTHGTSIENKNKKAELLVASYYLHACADKKSLSVLQELESVKRERERERIFLIYNIYLIK